MGFVWTVVSHLHQLAGPVVMLLYPLYASVRAIESESKDDDQQWLTYWILYSSITFLELVASPVFAWIPMWSYIKLACACWLALPPFRGAYYAYEWAVRGHILKMEKPSIYSFRNSLTESQRKFLDLLSPEARESLESHIQVHGTHTLDSVIAAANKETYKNNPFA